MGPYSPPVKPPIPYIQVVSEEDPPRRVYFDPVSGGLSVNRVTGRDAGLYTCVARSVAGVAETSVPVFVQDDMSESTVRPVLC